MANPLDAYGKVLNTRGLGTPKTRLDAMIESGELTDPSKRFPENKRTALDDVLRFGLGLYNKKEAGGPGFYNLPPKNIKEATKQVVEAAKSGPDLTGAKFDEDGKLIGKTPDDFKPFDPTTIDNVKIFESTPGPDGPKLVQDLTKPGSVSKTFPGSGAGDEALAQLGVVEKETSEKNKKATAEGEAIFDAKQQIRGAESDALDKLFEQSMEDYLTNVRGVGPETRTKDLEEYKREFAEATGIDISGKVDKSSALMSLGLAMMQNRAGKGFNVGRLFSEFGKAGEAALPALEKAKTQARNDMIAAGKYALETRSVDKAADAAAAEKLKQRNDYYIIPKGEGISGTIANLDKGSLQALNLSELDALRKNENFSKQFDVLPGSTWAGVVAEAMKTPEAKQLYDTKTPRKIELFGEGAGNLFTIETWRALPGSGKENLLVGTGTDTYKALSNAARDLNKAKQKFVDIMPLVEGTNVFRFAVDKVDSIASAFGINVREGSTPTEQLKLFLTKLQAQNAKEILGEAGKTISDADRALVASIVGDLTKGATADELQDKLDGLFTEIIIKKEQQIVDALSSLDRYTGRNVASALSDGDISAEERKEMEADLKSLGLL
jgi:hypothetical protein